MKIRSFILSAIALVMGNAVYADNFELQSYTHQTPYQVETLQAPKGKKVKNVILMIGDGMSLAHIQCAWTCNRGHLWLENATHTGLSETPIVRRLVADSGSGGTAMATGTQTIYHAVGVDENGTPKPSLIDYAHAKGLSTGVAVTCRLWDATPCDFLAHNIDRDQEQDLVGQFPKSPVDYVFGGGAKFFEKRDDGRNIFNELKDEGYEVTRSFDDFAKWQGGKAYCVPFDVDTPLPDERGDLLARASLKEVKLMSQNKKGFFMMVEGSQLDDYGHFNQIDLLMKETLDFDQTIGALMKWAAEDGETLIVVTADHETGGLALLGGNLDEGKIDVKFTTGDHSGTMVPVYAFGPGAEEFTGFMKQKDICWKIKKLLKM